MFINYWFIAFIAIFFPIYWLFPIAKFRKHWLLLACLIFHYRFAGPAGVLPIIFLGVATYFAGISEHKAFRTAVISFCVLELIFYKYTNFLITQTLGHISESFSQSAIEFTKNHLLPAAPPLAISFFVFEFVHYLVDLQRGKKPIKSVADFSLFAVFWPSVVAGPIKRFEQFLPSVMAGCQKVSLVDIQLGTMRIMTGLIKKLVIADYLTGYIDYYQQNFNNIPVGQRWLVLAAISLRILFDFSGYSDMAIGFARLMGIKLPENFNWPYLATSLQDFWRRWHISLSSWIRDYVYIPLGGSQQGTRKKISNGLIAFTLCGLWHGAAWNFIVWGVYHGLGLLAFKKVEVFCGKYPFIARMRFLTTPLAWFATFLFVSIGWLYFFYSFHEATVMLRRLFRFSH